MQPRTAGLRERLATRLADMRPLPRLRPHAPSQVAGRRERLATSHGAGLEEVRGTDVVRKARSLRATAPCITTPSRCFMVANSLRRGGLWAHGSCPREEIVGLQRLSNVTVGVRK